MDRRNDHRLATLKEIECRVGARIYRALLSNVSLNGCMITTLDGLVEAGGPIYLKLSDGIRSFGRVIWQHDNNAGIRFDEQLPGQSVLDLGFYGSMGQSNGAAEPVDRLGRPLSPLVRARR